MAKDTFWDDLIKIGLILGSVWMGSEILKDISDNKKGDSHEAGS